MTRTGPRRKGADDAFVRCRICGEDYRFISWRHLAFAHGWDSPDALKDYRRLFPSARLVSPETIRRARASQRRRFDRTGRTWSLKRLQDLIRTRLRRGLPLHASSVKRDCESAYTHARRWFGSWKALLKSCGILSSRVALRIRRSR